MPRTGRPRLKNKLSVPIKTLAYEEDARAFERACEVAKQQPADVLRSLADAWVNHVKNRPRATLHFRLVELED